MRKLLVAAMGVALFAVVGCQHDKDKMHSDTMSSEHRSGSMAGSSSGSSTDTMAVDDCSHCPGVQKADANGMCPVCHMKVK